MSKVKQKQLQKLRLEKDKKNQEYEQALKRLIHSQETLQITLDYCQQFFRTHPEQSLQEYSPTHISRLIYDQQLQKIQQQMTKLPDEQCRIQHFIVMMISTLSPPFQKAPLYMVGLKDMFKQIAVEGKETITFKQIFKYVVGEVVVMKQDQQHTQFHIQFEEKKKQDFLLHDNGIKRIHYSQDLRTVLSLDQREQTIKIYDQDMKNTHRFSPRKEMHNGRAPLIVDFDYSEMTMRLGVIYSDQTIESIHLPNFMHKSEQQFEASSLNQLLFPLPKPMKRIYYLHMINKWLTLSEQINQIFLLDMQKVRLRPEQVLESIVLDTNQMTVSCILQVVHLSTICVVAGNQITFLEQSLHKQKYPKFIYHQIISVLKYCEQNSTFYLSGQFQKTITMFSITRSRSFKSRSFSINAVIVDFQVFSHYQTLLIVDQNHEIRLIHQPTQVTSKQQSYAHIVKIKDQQIHCHKMNKTDFMIYQTYMIGFTQERVAIEKEIDMNFLGYQYYDQKKEEFYFSLNEQIIAFSVPFAQIRKNYNQDSSNLLKHNCFFIDRHDSPFVVDHANSLYQLYFKNDNQEGENKLYKRQLNIARPMHYFYDEDMNILIISNHNSIAQIRNDGHNNFNPVNSVHFEGISPFVSARFCHQTKLLTFLTIDQLIYQFQNFQTRFNQCFKIRYPPENQTFPIVIDFHYEAELNIFIILNSNKELYFFQKRNCSNQIMIDLTECLPYKLKQLNFIKFQFNFFREKGKVFPTVILYDDSGFLLDLNLQKSFDLKFSSVKKEQLTLKSFPKEPYEVSTQNLQTTIVQLASSNLIKLSSSMFRLHKAHEKQITMLSLLRIEMATLLTFSKDTYVKLWNRQYECLFVLKLPNLLKIHWNMQSIHSIKNKKSIEEITEIIQRHYSRPITTHIEETISKTKKLKYALESPKKLKFQEEMPLEIDSKEVQDIVNKEENYFQHYLSERVKPTMKFRQERNTIDVHPWRNKKEFKRIFDRASPTNKYAKSMPRPLVMLRTSLDMTPRTKKQENYQAAELILPQLRSYQNQQISKDEFISHKKTPQEQYQNFQSCLYVKFERHRKKPNALDEIDRQFLKKQIEMKNRRISYRYREDNKNATIEPAEVNSPPVEEIRYDTIREIQSVFQQHNKECQESRKGRMIRIPQLRPRREEN